MLITLVFVSVTVLVVSRPFFTADVELDLVEEMKV